MFIFSIGLLDLSFGVLHRKGCPAYNEGKRRDCFAKSFKCLLSTVNTRKTPVRDSPMPIVVLLARRVLLSNDRSSERLVCQSVREMVRLY